VISPVVPLTYYSALIIAASVLGGMLPVWFRLTHRGLQIALSFVAAMMLGVGLSHMLPHALAEARLADASTNLSGGANTDQAVTLWLIAGCLTMFFIERFFCFHHHDVESDSAGELHEHEETCEHGHAHHHHDVTWSGAALGLTLHSVIEGVALGASVAHGHDNLRLAGLGTFLVILLHKPFDSMTIGMLMARSGRSLAWRHAVNGLFALAVPLGVAMFYAGLASAESSGLVVAYALAFSAGTFLCISLSDLLPELQFHDHDRVVLSAALVAGLALALGIGQLESLAHQHPPTSTIIEGAAGLRDAR